VTAHAGEHGRVRSLVVFEDARWRDLRPLTDVLPVQALAFGGSDLSRRWVDATGLEPARAMHVRRWVGEPFADPAPEAPAAGGDVLFVNAAALPGPWLESVLPARPPARFTRGGRLVAAWVAAAEAGALPRDGADPDRLAAGAAEVEVEARVIEYPWHLIEWNAAALTADLEHRLRGRGAGLDGVVDARAAVLGSGNVRVEPGARVDALAVLDAREGPIVIEEHAVVLPNTVIEGPCRVGAGTQLLGGFVRRCSIGPQCRIAGEVEESVWQGHANKRHHGFVGHSLIGEWVNLGALTTTSDLKNNYGPVRVWVDGREIDSGVSKVGSILGAHVKTGIGTLLPTGCSVGVGANLFGGGRFAPKRVPAFGWWDGDAMAEHRLDAFLVTARIATSRRGRQLSADGERLLRELFAATAPERVIP
jgi:UDP-N-acetylglucosamine diphosphorylase/glucosamine-1-phosphate N-acetyltransferase